MTKQILTQARLKEVLHYNPGTGKFTWILSRGRVSKGHSPSHISSGGYLKVKVDGVLYSQHRLAILYMTGCFPVDEVDHINHIRADNRWSNIRPVTRSENKRNSTIRKDNSSGNVGVLWYPKYKKWSATICSGGRRVFLGYHETIAAAISARNAAEIKYGYHKNHGI